MANVKYTDADGATRESYSSKAGNAGDPDLSPETLHNDLVTIQGYVDGLETAIASTNTKLDTVHTDLGTLLTTGTPITGQSLESGGAGGLGWLSSVRKKVSDLIALLPTALGQATMANSLAVTIASNQSAVPASQSGTWTVQPGNTANTTAWLVKESRSATGTTTSVADSASNQTILASNANRLGATIYNDSTVALYLKLGATATTSSFSVKIAPEGYYEVPCGYTGIIDGIWASDASGSARITELT